MSARLRRAAAPAAFFALLAGTVTLGATPAIAVTTTSNVTFQCETQVYGIDFIDDDETYVVTFTAPATATNGNYVSLTYTLDHLPTIPIDVSAVSTTTTARVEVSRPSHALDYPSAVTSPSAPVDAAGGSPYPGTKTATLSYRALTNLSGQTMTIRPAPFVLNVVSAGEGYAGAVVTCTPVDIVPLVLAVIVVTGAPPACLATDTCSGTQTHVGTVPDNSLSTNSVPAAGWTTSNDLGSFGSATGSSTASANVKFARVTDTRSGNYGWSLTADFDGKLHDASGAAVGGIGMSVTNLACAETVGASGSSAPTVGTGGNLSTPKVLCSVAAGALGNTGLHGGQWDITGTIGVTVPPFARAGTYTGVVTLTLS